MKNRLLLGVLSLSVALLAGCSAGPAAQAGTSATPSVSAGNTQSGCEDATYSESVKEDPFECKAFTSTTGHAAGKDLPWVKQAPLEATFNRMNGALTMVVRMPCGVLNVPVTVDTDTLTPDPAEMIQSADGCSGPAGDQRTWTTDFLSQPLKYSLDQQVLVLTNNLGEITFAGS